METCLKYLLPLSCFLLVAISFWQVAMPSPVLAYVKYAGAAAALLLVVWVLIKVWTTRSRLPFAGVKPLWRPESAYQDAPR
jgi:hypothetical protein